MNRLAKLKKAQIASQAERLVAGSGRLHVMFRTPEPAMGAEGAPDAKDVEIDTDATVVAVEDVEDAHAAA